MNLLHSFIGRRALPTLLGSSMLLFSAHVNAQQVTPQSPSTEVEKSKAANVPTTTVSSGDTASKNSDDSPLELSPFEVNTSRDLGYYASSSMSGTRLNSSLEDLASPISVVTKQQIIDTASLDINDIFLYETNTEGMGQYTDFTIDRGFYIENTTLNPQSSNRIRGLSAANMAANNFAVSSAIPLDTYNVDSIEISRGPNANIFGLGNAGGTVNVNTGRANMSRNVRQVVGRFDSYGGKRGQLDLNQVLLRNKLAFRVASVHDEKGFERRPSYEEINRITTAVSVRPFKRTTLRASYESYSNHFSRANTTLPRDSITEWMNNGMPVWNPVTSSWRYLDGSTYTAVTSANESTSLPLGLTPGTSTFWAAPSVFIEGDGSVSYYGMNAAGSSTTGPAPASAPTNRYVETGTIYRRSSDITKSPATPLILFQPLSITDKSIYDWTKINYLSPNYGRDGADIYSTEIEQNLISTDRHQLNLQLGYYKEVIDRYDHSVFSRSDSGTPYISVDVNEYLLDGTKNPYFLRPYIAAGTPTIKYTDLTNEDSRATLAYQLDLSREKSWLKWFGHHNFAGYGERRDLLTRSLTGRDINTTDYSWTSTNDLSSLPLRGNTYRLYPRYYLGDAVTNGGSVVDYAPAQNFSLGSTPLTWYTSARTRVDESAAIREIIQSGSSKKTQIRTVGATWQGFFLDDRVVTVLGWRKDRNRERSSRSLNSNNPATNTSSTIDSSTREHDLSYVDQYTEDWSELSGTSRNAGIVVKVTPWLNLNYSRSNSFKPEEFMYDINTNLLPNPTGKSYDVGATFKLLGDKLTARISRYETKEKNSRNGSITSAAVTRTLRLFFDPRSSNALETQTPSSTGTFSNGQDAFDLEQSAAQWYLQLHPSASAAEAQQYAVTNYLAPLGIDQNFISTVRTLGDSAFTDVNTVISKGYELEVTYNPTRNWTMKLTGAQQQAVDTELGHAVNDFMDSKLDAVRQIIVPTTSVTTANGTAGNKWWLMGATSSTATGTSTPAGFYVANVKSVIGLATANEGKPRAQTREYRMSYTTNFKLAGISDNKWLKATAVGGTLRWEDRACVGYYGSPSTDPEYKGAVVEYDASRPIYDKARTYVDLNVSHNLKLWDDKLRCRLQLNVSNVFENGRLQPIAYNPDGTPWNYRIIDPRKFIFTVTFDL